MPLSDPQLRQLFELAPDVLCVLAADGHVLALNPSGRRLLGLDSPEGEPRLAQLVHEDDRARVVAALERLGAGEGDATLEFRCRGAAGDWRRMRWTLRSRGEPPLIYGAAHDETEHADAELVLQRHAESLERAQRELVAAYEELERMATVDALSALPNRRAAAEIGESELGRARRRGHPISTALFDIDHFKRVNDRYGHAAGDEVIRQTAARIRMALRPYDTVARWGGEEFLAILPHTDEEQAAAIAQRVVLAVGTKPLALPEDPRLGITISGGVASTSERPEVEWDELVDAADWALFRAKRRGRNRIEVESARRDPPMFPRSA